MELDLQFDEQKLENIIKTLSPEILLRTQKRAISVAASKVVTTITREIIKEYNIKAREVKRHIRVAKGVNAIRVNIDAEKISLINFATNKSRATYYTVPVVKIKKNEASKRLPGMFYAVMQSGHMGIFIRARAKARYGVEYGSSKFKRVNKGKEELSVIELVGIDIVNSVNKTKAEKKVLKVFADAYQSEFIRQLKSNGFID